MGSEIFFCWPLYAWMEVHPVWLFISTVHFSPSHSVSSTVKDALGFNPFTIPSIGSRQYKKHGAGALIFLAMAHNLHAVVSETNPFSKFSICQAAHQATNSLSNDPAAMEKSKKVDKATGQSSSELVKSPHGYVIKGPNGRFGGFVGDCSSDVNFQHYWMCAAENAGNGGFK